MTSEDTRTMLGLTAPLLILAGLITISIDAVPAAVAWPFTLLFWSVGLGIGMGVLISINRAAERRRERA